MAARNDPAIWSGLFRLSPDSGQTLQAQIRQAIVAAILDRQIAASMPLPSCRVLADRLGVARGTVVLAFQQLVDQGFLVAPGAPRPFRQSRSAGLPAGSRSFRRALPLDHRLEGPPAHRGDRSARAYQAGQLDKGPLPLRLRAVRPGSLPDGRMAGVQPHGAGRPRRSATGRATASTRTIPLLIEQIQARLLPRRGIFANPDEIIVTLGAQNAIYMLSRLLMGPGTRVAMEEPRLPRSPRRVPPVGRRSRCLARRTVTASMSAPSRKARTASS